MGKIRAKRRGARSRPEPAGLPTTTSLVKPMEETEESAPHPQPILHRLASHDVTERKWACNSLSHLLGDTTQRTRLIEGRVVRRLAPLLLDQVMEIREAAAGALRNMSCVDDPGVLEYMAGEDIMTHLSALIKDTVARLDAGMEEGKKEKMTADRGVLLSILEEALCLLWNMSEASSVVVEVFNREDLLPLILELLQPTTLPLSLCLAAAQLLHVVTEDNQDAIRLVVSLPGTLSHLESVLDYALPDDACGRGQVLVLQAAIAGVFLNVLPALPEAVIDTTLCGVLAVVGCVLCVYTAPLLSGCQGNSETEGLRLIFSAQELACEVLANVCYNEGDGSDDSEWEDCDSVEDVEGAEMMDAPQIPLSRDLPCVRLIVESQTHNKVSSLFLHLCSVFEQCPQPVIERLTSLISAVLLTLQNLVSSLPSSVWQDLMISIWPTLFNLPPGYTDNSFPVLGLLLPLVEQLDTSQLLTEEQLLKVCVVGVASDDVGVASEEVRVRADVMRLVGAVATSVLRHTTPHLPMLQIAGSTLRDCVAKDSSLWVVSQALDSIFDMFGCDSCPPHLFPSLSLLPVLRVTAATFSARLRVERKWLGPHLSLVQSAKVNLPRFIGYMASKH